MGAKIVKPQITDNFSEKKIYPKKLKIRNTLYLIIFINIMNRSNSKISFLNNILKRAHVYDFYTNVNLKKSNVLHYSFKIVQKKQSQQSPRYDYSVQMFTPKKITQAIRHRDQNSSKKARSNVARPPLLD